MMSRVVLSGAVAAAALLAACDDRKPPAPEPSAAVQQAAVVEAPAVVPTEPTPAPDDLTTSRDPRRVVIAWAKAMSLKDWDKAYRFWGEQGARSGLTLDEFRARWGKIREPQFDIAEGRAEGAAGSLYYTAPITLIDGARRVQGEIVLRRANDVPGASAEQLRWHIERLELKP